MLAVVVAALALALAAPLRELLSQRSQISSLNTSIASQQQQVTSLQKAQQQWANPTYVEQQARDRLHYVFPGQVPYVTLSPTPVASRVGCCCAGARVAALVWPVVVVGGGRRACHAEADAVAEPDVGASTDFAACCVGAGDHCRSELPQVRVLRPDRDNSG